MGSLLYSGSHSIKDLFSDNMYGEAGPGRFLHGWPREPFEIMSETLRIHTIQIKKDECDKDIRDQDPDFGVSPLNEVLMCTSNSVRYISQFLSFDEEIISQLGRNYRHGILSR